MILKFILYIIKKCIIVIIYNYKVKIYMFKFIYRLSYGYNIYYNNYKS